MPARGSRPTAEGGEPGEEPDGPSPGLSVEARQFGLTFAHLKA